MLEGYGEVLHLGEVSTFLNISHPSLHVCYSYCLYKLNGTIIEIAEKCAWFGKRVIGPGTGEKKAACVQSQFHLVQDMRSKTSRQCLKGFMTN